MIHHPPCPESPYRVPGEARGYGHESASGNVQSDYAPHAHRHENECEHRGYDLRERENGRDRRGCAHVRGHDRCSTR